MNYIEHVHLCCIYFDPQIQVTLPQCQTLHVTDVNKVVKSQIDLSLAASTIKLLRFQMWDWASMRIISWLNQLVHVNVLKIDYSPPNTFDYSKVKEMLDMMKMQLLNILIFLIEILVLVMQKKMKFAMLQLLLVVMQDHYHNGIQG